MGGKGKGKQKHVSKLSLKKGIHSFTITEMFKKQSENKQRDSDKDNSAIYVEDDDDVIFVKGSTVSPYFNKMAASAINKTYSAPINCAFESPIPTNTRKRKLSLSRIDSNSSDGAVCINRENKNTTSDCDRIVEKADTDKLTETEKQNTKTELKRFPCKASSTKYKQQNGDVSSMKNPLTSPVISKLNSKAMYLSDIFSTPYTAVETNSSVELDLDIRYSPVFPKHIDSTDNKSTLNRVSSYKTDSEQTDTDISSVKKIHDEVNKKDIEVPVIDDDDSNNSVNGDDISVNEPQFKVPYYLNNFETILKAVMEDESNRKLFNDDDMFIITTYQQLSDTTKKLYIRMFSRKLHWIPLSKLKYSEIAEDLKPCLQELMDAGLIDCDDQMTDLEEVLYALSASDIKTLAKSYHITSHTSQKKQLVHELLKKSQRSTLTTMFNYAGKDVAKTMLTRAKKYLNGIYRLKDGPRRVFVRLMMLFSLVNTLVDEDNGTGGQGQLFQMLMVNMGKLVYPTYTIEKVHCVFQDRDDLIRFERALQLESDLLHCIERGQWDKAYIVFKSIEKEWDLLQEKESITEWCRNLPDFLRCFTASSVIHRLLSASVEILQRRKDYIGAVELLRNLLSENLHNCNHRGYLWERLALNLDAHLKQPLQSLEAVENGLADNYVCTGRRLALLLRADSICQRPKLKLQHRLKEFHNEIARKTPKVYIEGRVLHQGVSTNGTRFLTEESCIDGSSQDMTVMGVEEYVLHYYKRNGFPSGVHAEGSIVSTLFAFFFWDILFMPVSDAFHSPFQAMPLDLHSKIFYDRRRDAIEERLTKLRESSIQELQLHAEETWTNQHGVLCAGLNWDLMSLNSIKELLLCMGGEVLSGLVGRFARCPRHTRSGFPDLTLWNSETGALKICEVKGPGDRLSHKQILWIDYLVTLGVDAEVCHVKAVAAKKLRPLQQ